MDINSRISAFTALGEILREIARTGSFEFPGRDLNKFSRQVEQSMEANAWFTPESVFMMLEAIGESLQEQELRKWTQAYSLGEGKGQKTIAVVMAGNIPAVGFHDFLSVLVSGNKLLARLSTDDQYLIPGLGALLCDIEPGFEGCIRYTDNTIRDFDAVIATGSNNTSRYFEYYFGKYPNIIRKNRNALAVISGEESDEELKALGKDVFSYFGLGCRNVSMVFLPEGYAPARLLDAFAGYQACGDHSKYRNNYDYNKSIMLVNGDVHYDYGFLLMKEDPSMASPVSVLHFQFYKNSQEVYDYIRQESENIQCVVSTDPGITGRIAPGRSQYPALNDYADGVDTLEFLLNL